MQGLCALYRTTLSHAKFLQDSLPGFSVMSEYIAYHNKGKEDCCNKADKEGPVCTDEQGLRRAAWSSANMVVKFQGGDHVG